MRSEWPEHSLSEYIDIKHGFAFKGEYFTDEETLDILLTPGNFAIGGGFKADKFKYYDGPIEDDYILEDEDLIVTMTDLSKEGDTLGYSALVPKIDGKRLLHNQRIGLIQIRKDDELDKGYLYFLLRSREYRLHILSTASGTTVKHTSPSKILAFRFNKPPIELQRQIAANLLALENKIELNRQINQTLEQIAQAIFKSWFVDFDPVKAKIEVKEKCEDPERAAMCAISGKTDEELDKLSPEQLKQLSKTAALFPDELEESELGLIPRGWRVGIISDYGQVVTGKTPPTKVPDNFGEGVPFITPTDITDNTYIINTDRSLTKQGQYTVRNCVIPKYSVCVTCIGSQMGKTVINTESSITNQQINSIVLDHDFYRFYVYLNLRTRRNELRLMGSSGSTMPIINKKSFSELSILKPPIEVTKQFHHLVDSLFCEVLVLLKEARVLATLRDTLLPKLLTGEINITS